MMEIWIRSIARAGGVDMPAAARVLEADESPRRRRLRPLAARLLGGAGRVLVRIGDRLQEDTRPALRRG